MTAVTSVWAETWQRVSVPARQAVIERLLEEGADLEGMVREGDRFVLFATAGEAREWKEEGIDLNVVDPDVSASYAARAAAAPARPGSFAGGSMGGFFTSAEVQSELAQLRKRNPRIVSGGTSIGTTIEGRPMWAYKISDRVGKTENEPRVLFTALTHAREPQGMMCVLYFARYLVENYGKDPEATWLVDNREIWIVPVANPDGYAMNESENPGGGGMWRKNKRLNADGSMGVDLNRNYGYRWGYDNGGSSSNGWDETYRGAGPFSEPETAAVKAFHEKYAFKAALNFHCYGNLLIHPWGFINSVPEPEGMKRMSGRLNAEKYFRAGNSYATVHYPVNGGADDWFYAASHAYSFTPELGTWVDSFWPAPDRIEPLCQMTLQLCLRLATLAGDFVTTESSLLMDKSGNGVLRPGEKGTLRLTLSNLGAVGPSSSISVRIYSTDPKVKVTGGGPFVLPELARWASKKKAVSLQGGTTIPVAATIPVCVEFSIGGKVMRRETVSVAVGP